MRDTLRPSALCIALLAVCLAARGQDTGTITGRVLDESTATIEGARVTLGISGQTRLYKTAQTEPDGSFHLASLPTGTYDIEVEKAGFPRLITTGIEIHEGEVKQLDLTLIDHVGPCPPGMGRPPSVNYRRTGKTRVSGSALAARPLSGASITLAPKRGGKPVHGASDGRGRFLLDNVARGTYTLTVSIKGYADFIVDVVKVKSEYETRIEPLRTWKCPRQGACPAIHKIVEMVVCQ